MKAWKIVYNDCSIIEYVTRSDFYVEYEIGYTTFPILGRLFVFKSLIKSIEYAERLFQKRFLTEFDYVQFLYGESLTPRKITFLSGQLDSESISFFWKRKQQKRSIRSISIIAPQGTYSCSSFKPVKSYTFVQVMDLYREGKFQ